MCVCVLHIKCWGFWEQREAIWETTFYVQNRVVFWKQMQMDSVELEHEIFLIGSKTQNTSGLQCVMHSNSPSTWMLSLLISIYSAFIQVSVAWSQVFILDQSRKTEISKSLWTFIGQRYTILKKTRVAICRDYFSTTFTLTVRTL